MSDQAPSPQLFFETINAFQRTSALKAAIELELFTAIGQDAPTAAELAARASVQNAAFGFSATTLLCSVFS